MDDKLFDKIIKEKAESHIDPSKPSGAEMSRLFDQLPPSGGGSWFASTTNRVVSVAATTLLILTIFLIYRTFRLEETIELLDERVQQSSIPQTNVIYKYDTATVDSLARLSIRLNQRLDSLLTNSAIRTSNLSNQTSTNDRVDLNEEQVANAVMAQLIKEIESNPALMEQIRKQLSMDEAMTEDARTDVPEEEEPEVISSKTIASALIKEDVADEVLYDLASDPEHSKAISNLISDNDPNEEDGLTMNISKEEIENMSDEKKEQLLKEYLEYNPEAVASAVEASSANDETQEQLKEYMAATMVESKKMEVDSVERVTKIENLEEIREEQAKARDRSILLGGGVGIGRVPIDGFGTAGTTSFKLTGEYQPNQRFGFATGAEFYTSSAETHDVGSVDLSNFNGLTLDDDIDEVKVNLQWLDIPLEAKLYFKRGKFSPYAIVSIRARALLKESYVFEGDDEDFSATPESEYSFILPSYGYGLGTQFYLNPKLNGALQFHHSIGGEGVGSNEQQLNTIQLQGIIYFDLK